MRILISMLSVVALLLGCSDAKSNIDVGKFTVQQRSQGVIHIYEFIGVKGQFGMLDIPTTTGSNVPIQLYFWDEQSDLIGKKVKINLTNNETKEKISLQETIRKLEEGIIKPQNSDSSGLIQLSSSKQKSEKPIGLLTKKIKFPSTGFWNLEIYKDDKLFGSVEIHVTKSEDGLENLNK